jgi:predicted ATPase
MNRIARKDLQLHVARSGGVDTFLHFGKKSTESISLGFTFDDIGYATKLESTVDNRLIFVGEQCWSMSKNHRYLIGVTVNARYESALDDTSNGNNEIASEIREQTENWRVYHFNDTTSTAKIKSTAQLHDNRFLREDGSNLAPFLYLLRERYRPFYDRIIETIQLVAPFFKDFALKPIELNPNTILLEWQEKGSNTYFNADMLSDGTLRFMCLTTLLRQPNLPSLILLDEPELGLHPYAIVLLAGMIKGVATKTQIIVSTQSPTLVNYLEPEDIIVVDRENKASTFHRLNTLQLKDWLEDYSLSELWQKNVFGGRP